jgi:hypothetical protein
MTGDLTSTGDKFLDDIARNVLALEHKGRQDVFKIGCEIGEQLAKAQDHLSRQRSGDGGWLEWVTRTFPHWSPRTSYNYIGLYRFVQRHGGELETFQTRQIDLSAIYLLNAPSTPEEVRTEAIERAEAGEKVSRQSVKDAIDKHRGGTRTRTRSRRQPAREPEPVASPSDTERPASERKRLYAINTEASAQPAPWTAIAAINTLCDAIAVPTTPAEVVAEVAVSDPAALVRLAGDAGLASAWLGALQVLAASPARECDAGQGAPPMRQTDESGTQQAASDGLASRRVSYRTGE